MLMVGEKQNLRRLTQFAKQRESCRRPLVIEVDEQVKRNKMRSARKWR